MSTPQNRMKIRISRYRPTPPPARHPTCRSHEVATHRPPLGKGERGGWVCIPMRKTGMVQ